MKRLVIRRCVTMTELQAKCTRTFVGLRMYVVMGVVTLAWFQRPKSASKNQKKTTDDPTESFHGKCETYNWMPSSFQVTCKESVADKHCRLGVSARRRDDSEPDGTDYGE